MSNVVPLKLIGRDDRQLLAQVDLAITNAIGVSRELQRNISWLLDRVENAGREGESLEIEKAGWLSSMSETRAALRAATKSLDQSLGNLRERYRNLPTNSVAGPVCR